MPKPEVKADESAVPTVGVLVKTARERIAEAVKGRDPNGLTGVKSGDVVEVASAIPADKREAVVETLLKGATGAGPNAEVWSKTEHLLHLLEKAG